MFSRLSGLLALAFAGFCWAAGDPPVPPLSGAIVDRTGTLSAAELRSIDAELSAFSARRGSQIAVLIVPSTQPESIEQFSIRVADAWKIGRKTLDDGVILVIAKDERTLRLEVGYGLEGPIPDLIAKRVINETITPHFRNGDFAGGIRAGTATLMKLIEGEKLPPPASVPSQSGAMAISDLLVPLIFAVGIGSMLMKFFGKLTGAGMAGTGFGLIAGWMLGSFLLGLLAAALAFVISLISGASGGAFHSGGRGGGFGSGGFGGGGGGFSGGGGGFGGGGASGRW